MKSFIGNARGLDLYESFYCLEYAKILLNFSSVLFLYFCFNSIYLKLSLSLIRISLIFTDYIEILFFSISYCFFVKSEFLFS